MLLAVLSVIFTVTLNAAAVNNSCEVNKDNPRKLFRKAMAYFEKQNYGRSLPLLLKLSEINPGNHNINFFIGVCYFNSINNKLLGTTYLESASANMINDYTNSYSQISAPVHAAYYLGRSYEYSGNYSKAIESYNNFKKYLVGSKYRNELIEVNERISTCLQALKRIEDEIENENQKAESENRAIAEQKALDEMNSIKFAKLREEEEKKAYTELAAELAAKQKENAGKHLPVHNNDVISSPINLNENNDANLINGKQQTVNEVNNQNKRELIIQEVKPLENKLVNINNEVVNNNVSEEITVKKTDSQPIVVANTPKAQFAENNFYVQFATGKMTLAQCKGLTDVYVCEGADGIIRYISGSFTDYASASQHRAKAVELGFQDAWIAKKGVNYSNCKKLK